ncbi:hypothetical protein BDW74DRAFT_177926 [Aspergillus multicolor]|uniref:uncharacterized protein n=1 Tax=Aspergillus multicolor TaxID=41759 RepID=UPI003CCCFA00
MPPLHTLLTAITLSMFLSIATANFTPCVTQCINNTESASWCQGDETGREAVECLCRHLDPSPLIECIRDCSPSDQWEFAGDLPQNCRDDLFPEAVEGESNDAGSVILGKMGHLLLVGGFVVVVNS